MSAGSLLAVAAVSFALTDGDETRRRLILALTAIWGTRLGAYLFRRWRHRGPDPRYEAMLRRVTGSRNTFTLTRIFLAQGALMWIVSLPVQLGQVYARPAGMTAQAYAGFVLCAAGILLESAADAQLVRFRGDAASEGKVMDRGLWRYSRHPNYFGEACVWWGLLLIALTNATTAAAVAGPVTITTLLLRWSGIGPLERRLRKRRPAYEEYARRTSAFVPLPPKRPAR